MDINEWILNEIRRGDCYRLLSACYYPPNKELYLEENLFENLSTLLKSVCPDAAVASAEMGEAIRKYSDQDLTVEYAKLFVGPFELKAPPYGSVYLDRERRVMGDSTMEVIRMYQEQGLSIDEDFKELPDHIAVELEFMNFLIDKEIDACMKSRFEDARNNLKIQEPFLKKYLGTWVPHFSTAIVENSNNPFYIHLAKCTEMFIKADTDHLSGVLKKCFEEPDINCDLFQPARLE